MKIKNVNTIIVPPRRGIGLECTLRASGLSQKKLTTGVFSNTRNIKLEKTIAAAQKVAKES